MPSNLLLKKVLFSFFFVANTFQIQPFHKGLAKQADFCFMPGADINYQCRMHWHPIK
jgi:hypothetical protein